MTKKIVIIGGGNSGLCLAVALLRKGFDVKVFEKYERYLPFGGDIGFWGNGLEVLDKLDLYDIVANKGYASKNITLGHEDDELIDNIPIAEYTKIKGYPPINICRYQLINILAHKVGQNNLFFNKKCINIHNNDNYVKAEFSDGSSICADIIIGADGKNSIVRDYIYPDSQLEYCGYISLGGIISLAEKFKYNFIYGENYAGTFPINQKEHVFFFEKQHHECDITTVYPNIEKQIDLFKSGSNLVNNMLDKLLYSTKKNQGFRYFFVNNYNIKPLSRWYNNRLVLIGESSQLVGSILGCSTSVILESINTLANCLQKYPNDNTQAFSEYQHIHQIRSNGLLKLERKIYNNFLQKKTKDYLSFQEDLIEFLQC